MAPPPVTNLRSARAPRRSAVVSASAPPPASSCLSIREIALVVVFAVLGAAGTLQLTSTRALIAATPEHAAPLPPVMAAAAGAPAAAPPATAASPCAAPSCACAAAASPAAGASPSPPPPPPPAAAAHAAPTRAPWDPEPEPVDLSNTAIVTMASNDVHGALALTLMQSLRDTGTRVPHLVLMLMRGGVGSADCASAAWKTANGRTGITCHSAETIAPEVVSSFMLAEFERLGVEVSVHDPIPPTEYTKGIPGGTMSFWGMALNKLKVFSLAQYRKVIWMDSDDYIVANIDHLMGKPAFTGSMVTACCHPVGPAYPGGGIWVIEPSLALYNTLLETIAQPRPGAADGGWNLGDMQVVRHFFGDSPKEGWEPLYPAINDLRHGYVGGLRYFAAHRGKSDAEWAAYIDGVLDGTKPRVEGFDTSKHTPGKINWMALDMRYDQCVGSFKCSPERDDPGVMFSVHFSCLQGISKPPEYTSEQLFMEAVAATDDHSRYWFLRWYETYKRATRDAAWPGTVGGPARWTGSPPVPGFNATYQAEIDIKRLTNNL